MFYVKIILRRVIYVSHFRFCFVFNYVSLLNISCLNVIRSLNVVLFKNRLMSYLCLNIVHILILFHIFMFRN